MRAYDRYRIQKDWLEKGKMRLIPGANFYLCRAYFILRDTRERWHQCKLDEEFRPAEQARGRGLKGSKERYSRWTKFQGLRFDEFGRDGKGAANSSTPATIVDMNFRRFLEKFTD